MDCPESPGHLTPLTIESGKKRTVHARYIRNRHLIDALHAQAFAALTGSLLHALQQSFV